MRQHDVVLVAGDTDYPTDDAEADHMRRLFDTLEPSCLVVHGDTPGAARAADRMARARGVPTVRVPYFGWLGRAGGPVRNMLMIEIARALTYHRGARSSARCWAFGDGAGTTNCAELAQADGVFEVKRLYRIPPEDRVTVDAKAFDEATEEPP